MHTDLDLAKGHINRRGKGLNHQPWRRNDGELPAEGDIALIVQLCVTQKDAERRRRRRRMTPAEAAEMLTAPTHKHTLPGANC